MSHVTSITNPACWTFLSNSSLVLICLASDPMIKMREVALRVGITERAVQRLITELESLGVIKRTRRGRQNSYEIDYGMPLRHVLECHRTVGELLKPLLAEEHRPAALRTD
jgi:predicted transcriptional regulator